jgi:hypothetical protein
MRPPAFKHINERRPPLQAHQPVHRRASLWLGAILGSALLFLSAAATVHAAEGAGNPNDYQCSGHISAGVAEVGSSETQVRYTFSCSGPITGYQLEAQIPLTGFEGAPLVSNEKNEALSDTFSCGGEVPGYADNCVGSTKVEYETITGQFAIGTKLCAEPRVDPLLTVTYAYLEKDVVTQAISGPFDLGRPLHCPASTYKGGTRLNPTPVATKTKKSKAHKKKGKSSKPAAKAVKKGK